MIKKIITTAVISTALLMGASKMANADNQTVVGMAPQFDKRIVTAYINGGNTVILQGYFPKSSASFQADFVASSWCGEFDSQIQFIQIRQMNGKMVGGALCSN